MLNKRPDLIHMRRRDLLEFNKLRGRMRPSVQFGGKSHGDLQYRKQSIVGKKTRKKIKTVNSEIKLK